MPNDWTEVHTKKLSASKLTNNYFSHVEKVVKLGHRFA